MSDDESVTEEPAAAAALRRGSKGDWSGGVGVCAAADSLGGPYVFVRGCAYLCASVRARLCEFVVAWRRIRQGFFGELSASSSLALF